MQYGQKVEVKMCTPVQRVTGSAPGNKDKMKSKPSSWPSFSFKHIPSKIYVAFRRKDTKSNGSQSRKEPLLQAFAMCLNKG